MTNGGGAGVYVLGEENDVTGTCERAMRPLSGISLVAVLLGCNVAESQGPSIDLRDLPATITLSVGQSRQVGPSIVTFQAVANDSRCPSDVVCVWVGNAELEFAVGPAAGEGPSFQVKLNTGLEPRTGSARGLKLTVLGLAPSPVSTRPTRGYRVELRVESVVE